MRLLNAKRLVLEEYLEDNAPPYAILSHRWRDGEEVSFQDIIRKDPPKHKTGYEKILRTCQQALEDGYSHAWVDTCGIDKSSSAELSESINSMFRWYQKAKVCYVYLADVKLLPNKNDQALALAESEWFERGWTLQELLAPSKLLFYSSDWSLIGDRDMFLDTIQQTTGIDRQFLTFLDRKEGLHIHKASIAERMSWASSRRTTRSEDVAYCMLGIFGISMPLLYGEGDAAFIRLQEELIRHSDDQTILAWDIPVQDDTGKQPTSPVSSKYSYEGVLAKSPAFFAGRSNLIPRRGNYTATEFSVSNKGVTIEAPFCITDPYGLYLMLLCGPKDDPTAMIALPLLDIHVSQSFLGNQGNQYAKGVAQPITISYDEWRRWRTRMVHLLVRPVSPAQDRGFENGGIWVRHIPDGFQFNEAAPPDRWSSHHRMLDRTINRGILNTTEPTASFVLRPPSKEDGLSCIRVSLDAMFLPHSVTQTLGISPFRASCTVMSMESAENTTHSTDQPTVASQQMRRASYIRLADGSLLYAEMSLQSILDKQFLIVDINVTARNHVRKAWILLRHSCVDYLTAPLYIPMDLPAVEKCFENVEHVWVSTTVASFFGWWVVILAQILAPDSEYVAIIFCWRNLISSRLRSIFIQSFWSAYSVLARSNQSSGNFMFAFYVAWWYYALRWASLLTPRMFKLLFLGTWVITISLTESVPWSEWIRSILWSFAAGYSAMWWRKRMEVFPPTTQPPRPDQRIARSPFFLLYRFGINIIPVCLFFAFGSQFP